MRYLLQLIVMLGDILLIIACAWCIHNFGLLGILMSCITYNEWKFQGGWMAWNGKDRRAFMKNAKELGL